MSVSAGELFLTSGCVVRIYLHYFVLVVIVTICFSVKVSVHSLVGQFSCECSVSMIFFALISSGEEIFV